MDYYPFFKSIVDEDKCAVVVCDTEHKIIYMNPAAVGRYSKRGGASLVGKNLLDCHGEESNKMIIKTLQWFKSDKANNRIHSYFSDKENKDVYIVALRDSGGELIGYYEKHEYRSRDEEPLYNFNRN